ncbi:MAG TPA: pitrilysin family protein [Bacteroidia bacterium]|nr:pitrilysin family protein [Bacteroidia bacterium]
MKKFILLAFLFLGLKHFALEFPVKSFTLPNGLKVIVCEKNTSPMVQMEVWYRVGSKDEWDGIRGMAHMFEHMMFRGSKKFNGEGDVYIHEMEKLGAQINAYTTFDRTVYWQELPKEHIEKVFAMEADRMENLILDQKVLDTEREVVGEELRLGENNWYNRMSSEKYKHLYPAGHPYKVDVIGYLDEITKFTTKQCQDFYDKFYSPNNAYLVIVGDVKAEQMFEYASKYFGTIKKQLPLNAKKTEPDLFSYAPTIEEMQVDYPVQIYSYVIPAPAVGTPDYYKFNLLRDLLFSNSNSILNNSIVEKGNLAYAIQPTVDDSRLYSNIASFDVIMQAQMGNAKVKKMISKEIYDIINEGIEQELIDNYVKNLEASQTFQNFSNQAIADKLGFAEYYFMDYNKYNQTLDSYKTIKAEQLTDICKKYFNPENIKVINIKPAME